MSARRRRAVSRSAGLPRPRTGGTGGGAGSGPADGGTIGGVGVRGADPCPCGSSSGFAGCCEPVLDGAPAASAEALMRSRFTAFVVRDEDHLFRTWHPRTRPAGPYCDPATQFTRLEVHAVEETGAPSPEGDGRGVLDADEAVVEFTARYRGVGADGREVDGAMRERSLFRRRAGRWLYVEALRGDGGPAVPGEGRIRRRAQR